MVIVRTYIKYSIDTTKMSMAMMKLLTKSASENIQGRGKQASSSQKVSGRAISPFTKTLFGAPCEGHGPVARSGVNELAWRAAHGGGEQFSPFDRPRTFFSSYRLSPHALKVSGKEGVLGGAGEVHAVRTSNSPVSITMRESRLLVISLTSLSVRAFDPGNNYVQYCLQKMSRSSTPALHRASGNRLRGAGLGLREKAPFYEGLGTKPAAKVRCQLPPGQVASRE